MAENLERLDKLLSNSGYGTRKDVKRLVRGGLVTVNGNLVKTPEEKVDLYKDEVCVEGEKLEIYVNAYFMMNKKAGYVCSTRSDSHELVMDLLKDEDRRKYLGGDLSMVGRLDLDTEGLLIITSDGQLNHRLTFPKYHVAKTYLVYLRDSVTPEMQKDYVEKVAAGIHIAAEGKADEADCAPAEIEWQNPEDFSPSPDAVCHITVYEGMFHEVKRIFAALGNEVVYLKRLRMNNLWLDESLEPGTYRSLTEEELKLLDVNQE